MSFFPSKDLVSKAFLKYRIFDRVWKQLDKWLLGAFNHNRNIAFVYVDEIVRYAYDNYPTDWANDFIIRCFSLSAFHELAHEDYPKFVPHPNWDKFLVEHVWKHLR